MEVERDIDLQVQSRALSGMWFPPVQTAPYLTLSPGGFVHFKLRSLVVEFGIRPYMTGFTTIVSYLLISTSAVESFENTSFQ